MKLGIVIPTHNRRKELRQLLIQISKQEVKVDYEIQTIVVIDGSSDGTGSMIEQDFPSVKPVFGDGSWWFTKSINVGIKQAIQLSVDVVLTINDDVVLSDHFLEQLKVFFTDYDNTRIVGAVSYSFDDKTRITSPGVKKIIWWRAKTITYYSHIQEVDPNKLSGLKESLVLPTRGLLIPANIAVQLNYLDEKFPQYFSDNDFCLRAINKGYKAYISFDVVLFTLGTTNDRTTLKTVSIRAFLKSFFNKYSRTYLPHLMRYYWRHGNKVAIPITICLIFSSALLKILSNKRNLSNG